MYRSILLLLCGIMIAMLATACPRDKGGTDTSQPPKTDIDVNVNTDDKTSDSTDTTDSTTQTPDGTQTPPADGTTTTDGTQTPPADGTQTPPADTPPATPPAAGAVTKVAFETTKGKIVMEVHPEWSPIGAAHFIELVNAKFYDGAPWFRVLEGFVAQCGVSADPAMNTRYMESTIQDEPVIQGNEPGYVAFGKTMAPNSRSTHIFINFGDNRGSLDGQGFSCFAKVIEGMDVAQKLERVEYQDQAGLAAAGGIDAFKKAFPNADFITKAYVVK